MINKENLDNKLNQDLTSQDSSIEPANYDIDLSFFSGPMDLLLHLVSLKEVSIEDVSMSEVLEQYCEIVNSQAHEIDLEKASEYLVIISTLMVIKSKALLPPDIVEVKEDEVDLEYSRFFESLRDKLKAYELTKVRAEALINTPQLGVDTFIRADKNAIEIPSNMIAEGESLTRLTSLFHSLLKKVGGLGSRLRISIEPVSIVDSMMKIVDTLKSLPSNISSNNTLNLISLLKNTYSKSEFNSKTTSRNIIMGNFIAILELAKRGVLAVSQKSQSDEIEINLRIKSSNDNSNFNEIEGAFESEFDNNTSNIELASESNLETSNTLDINNEINYTEIPNKRVING